MLLGVDRANHSDQNVLTAVVGADDRAARVAAEREHRVQAAPAEVKRMVGPAFWILRLPPEAALDAVADGGAAGGRAGLAVGHPPATPGVEIDLPHAVSASAEVCRAEGRHAGDGTLQVQEREPVEVGVGLVVLDFRLPTTGRSPGPARTPPAPSTAAAASATYGTREDPLRRHEDRSSLDVPVPAAFVATGILVGEKGIVGEQGADLRARWKPAWNRGRLRRDHRLAFLDAGERDRRLVL